MYPTLLTLWLALSGRVWRAPRPRRRPAFRRPLLEALEDRAVPSTLTVLNALDSGAGSLRAAIAGAKSGDTIVFDPGLNGQTITLISDQVTINKSLDIEGPGANLLAISGNDTNRVFSINQGYTVTIAGLTITHGQANASRSDNGASGGGGIQNGGMLTVANDVFATNHSETHGGAIANGPQSTLIVQNCQFTCNEVSSKKIFDHVEGGAIWNGKCGCTATIIDSTFTNNRAVGGSGGTGGFTGIALGGAVHNDGMSTLTVENSTFIGNQAIGGSGISAVQNLSTYFLGIGAGGAITNDEGRLLVVSGCTFAYNQAIGGSNTTGNSSGFGYIGSGRGGALSTFGGAAAVTNSTFVGNAALGGDANTGGGGATLVGVGDGGAIVSDSFGGTPHPLTLSNCTFSHNRAVGGAGNTAGVFVGDGMGGGRENFREATATVAGSTFSGNSATGGPGGAGQNGGDGLGGAIANLLGSTLAISGCALSGNQAIGGAGGSGANGVNGFGGGLYNQGNSSFGATSLTVTGSTITGNSASGGAAGSGGSTGLGEGGGAYFGDGGDVCLDDATVAAITGNVASTSADDVFGDFTTC